MVNHVVSAKLNEEEYARILEICKKHSFTTSKLIKEAIAQWTEFGGVQNDSSRPQVQNLTEDLEFETKTIDDYLEYFRKRVEFGKHSEKLDDS